MSPDIPSVPGGRPYKRRIMIINKAFQYKFISLVMICVGLAVVIIALDMYTSMGGYVAEGAAAVDMAAVYKDSWVAFLVKLLVYMGGVFVVSLVVSHRIAGPLYRFEKSAEEVALGNLAVKVFIRKGDELGEFRETFNGMVDALREKVSEDVSRAKAAKRLLEDLAAEPALSPPAVEKARKALAFVSDIGKRFRLD